MYMGNTLRYGPHMLGEDEKYWFLYRLYDSVRESDPFLVADMRTHSHRHESWGLVQFLMFCVAYQNIFIIHFMETGLMRIYTVLPN